MSRGRREVPIGEKTESTIKGTDTGTGTCPINPKRNTTTKLKNPLTVTSKDNGTSGDDTFNVQ